MFGCVVAGRIVQTNETQVSPTAYTFSLERAYEINHLTVFLTGQPFPEGYGASVHLQFPGQSSYKPLGVLTNHKPSNIYKVKYLPPAGIDPALATGILGIQIDTLPNLETFATTIPKPGVVGAGALVRAGAGGTDVGMVAEKVVKNLFNYLHSYDVGGTLTADTPIPLGVFQRWYESFLNKIRNDHGAGFLERED